MPMGQMPAPAILPDDAGDAGATYFERHEDYERRLRDNSHRWYVPRIVPWSLLWHKRLVVIGGLFSALGEIALLAYLTYLMADGELLLLLLQIAKQNAVVAATGLVLTAFATMVSFRMPICILYFESTLMLCIGILHGYLSAFSIVMFPEIPNLIDQAWMDASADTQAAVQRRYSCGNEPQLCVDVLSARLKHHLTVILVIQALIAALQLLTSWAVIRLARSISKQSSFRIL